MSDLLERLAALEHDRWARWQRYLHSLCAQNADGSLTIPAAMVDRWERQIATSYADLSAAEQESDRTEARKTVAVLAAEVVADNTAAKSEPQIEPFPCPQCAQTVTEREVGGRSWCCRNCLRWRGNAASTR